MFSIVFFKGKKGNVGIAVIVAMVLVVGSIIFLMSMGFTNNLLGEFTDDVVSDNSFHQIAKDKATEIKNRNSSSWDAAFLILIMGLYICLFIAGFTMDSNPIFLIVAFLLIILVGWMGMHIENIYTDLLLDTPEISFDTAFPKAHGFMSNIALAAVGGMLLFGLGIFINNRVG